MVYLYISSNKVFLTLGTFVMHCQLASLLVSLPTNEGFFKSLELRRPTPRGSTKCRGDEAPEPRVSPLATISFLIYQLVYLLGATCQQHRNAQTNP